MIEGPLEGIGTGIWRAQKGSVSICFLGRCASTSVSENVLRQAGEKCGAAWLDQIHSNRAEIARRGHCGPGDALVTDKADLVCGVVTADCVPILLAGDRFIAAVHAGWRGLVAGVIPNTLDRMEDDPKGIQAWIGPAIGSCCYEVGEEVARDVSAATGSRPLWSPDWERPHLDLIDATRLVLEDCGVEAVDAVSACTRCESDLLFSYRRDGAGAGRNVALIWRSSDD